MNLCLGKFDTINDLSCFLTPRYMQVFIFKLNAYSQGGDGCGALVSIVGVFKRSFMHCE